MTNPSDICRRARFILHRRRAGRIARLPSDVRQQINLMLRDGLPYATIIARLGDAGKTLETLAAFGSQLSQLLPRCA